MASSTGGKEGMGSTYVLAHQLLPPCWALSQAILQTEMESREWRQGD